jgi:hypothetical protein
MSRMMRNSASARRNSLLSLGLPILVAAVILTVIVRALFSGSSSTNTRNGTDGVTVVPKTADADISIYMSGDAKKKIDGEEKLFPTDNRLEVKSGDADLAIEGSADKISADRLTEVAYRGTDSAGKHSFELLSAYLWVEAAADDTVFKLKSFTVAPKAGSVIALSQNAVGSNLYVLKGNADVSTEASNTSVGVNQMVTVLTSEAKTVKLPEIIKPIDSFFRTEDVYLKHNGDSYLVTGNPTESGATVGTGSGALPVSAAASAKGIVFTSPEDEASVEGTSVDVEGKIVNPSIVKITVNDKEAKIDTDAKTFSFKDFPLPANANDLVYRAFDANGAVLAKGVITVYSSTKKATTTADKPTVTTYPIADKEFQIVTPADNPYKTTENVVRIEGRLPKGAAKYITINGFKLSKFPQYGTYWYYFANKDYGTMNDGINTYEIKYYDGNDALIKTSQFIIVKEAPETAPATDNNASGSASGSSAG